MLDALLQRQLLRKGEHVLVAVSGGKVCIRGCGGGGGGGYGGGVGGGKGCRCRLGRGECVYVM